MNSRVGQGIDIHKLDNGTPLIVGGILIPSDKGSIGLMVTADNKTGLAKKVEAIVLGANLKNTI